MKLCPCGSEIDYAQCCGPYITGQKNAPTAEALMRSRYTAYVVHAIDYIMDTCLDEGKDLIDYKETKNWSERSRWLGLTIITTEKGGAGDTEGVVEFEAAYEQDKLKDIHRERAQFKKVNEKWLYYEGKVAPQTIVRSTPKIGRNEPCPCGSGKKYKQCCGH